MAVVKKRGSNYKVYTYDAYIQRLENDIKVKDKLIQEQLQEIRNLKEQMEELENGYK